MAGPACDRFGPRITFAATLLLGAIPTFCAGGATSTAGVLAIRFFVGILGGSFVPCQVWTTGFFDKNVVGTANALTAGLGNAGGGITYFVMPAIYNSLRSNQHESKHVAWRVSFVVPGILIVVTAVALLLLCPDTPTGKWSEREAAVDANMRRHSMIGNASVPGELSAKGLIADEKPATPPSESEDKKDVIPGSDAHFTDAEAHLSAEQMMDTAKGEVVRKPNFKEIMHVFASPQTWVTAGCYMCSFGAELSINSILGTWYGTAHLPNKGPHKLSTQEAGNWAAMFGLLNVVCRPLGGLVADVAYRATGSVWGKKVLLHTYGVIMGIFLIVLGQVNTHPDSVRYGLIAGLAFFLEGANGLNFALVPHVHPFANGVVSGITGASGNLGGILWSVIFRFESVTKSFWIIGILSIGINAVVSIIPPIPKGQIGGR